MPSLVEQTPLPGVVVLRPPFTMDARGSFVKPFSDQIRTELGADFPVSEVYWSASAPGTIRGMHFQLPPTTIGKIVFAVAGRVRDVILDLRRGSPTYGEHIVIDLRPDSGAVYVPHGCAHGFEVAEGPASLVYLQDRDFDPATDAGIRWDSFGMRWNTAEPIVSDRDSRLPTLEAFDSPFTWSPA